MAASPPKEERPLAMASIPLATEPSSDTTRKREAAPATVSRPHAAEPSGGKVGKREENAAGTVKVKTSPAVEPQGADPIAPTPYPAASALDMVTAALDQAATVTCWPP
ncbi:hypothetical protein GUJ93_ZPchr0011g28043 [Zizania palustris]|uniref:Uncharacterized protein n=1 Tax=Zizania palustris TaxID=103762 RepID=A0A8J5WM90_ZIZPA|nr:hypothetical protein GUJ93_ZPchr0011g28043 [Zizania palustris]